MRRKAGAGSALMAHHLLLDRPEDRMSGLVLHLDPHAVAEPEEVCFRLAGQEGLHGALFGNAGIAEATLADGSTRPAVRILVRDRAGADHRAGAQGACL